MSKLLRHGMTLVIDNNEVLSDLHSTCGSESDNAKHLEGQQGYGKQTENLLPGAVFIAALERATQSSWRLVCAALAVEQDEPFRTCFLSKETRNLLLLWHAWQNSDVCELPSAFSSPGENTLCPETLVLNVDIYRPLESRGINSLQAAESKFDV